MDRDDQLDESDRRLAEEFRAQIEASGSRTAFDGNKTGDVAQGVAADPGHGQDPDDAPSPADLDFASAMNALRRAKREGDPAAIAEAEKHLQDVCRAEMAAFECGRDA